MIRAVALHGASDPDVFGGKAVELGAAIRGHLPVPEGVALSVALVAAVAAGGDAACQIVHDVYAQLGGAVAARSSAVGEDSAAASFAGQHATKLNVTSAKDLVTAVREVHASGHAASALAYRKRVGNATAPRIGVVVQRLVHADTAGVLFTRCPVSGRDERVIESAWGLGEIVVAGLVNPDRYRLDRAGKILERTIGHKDLKIVPRAGGGTEEVAVDHAKTASLSDEDLRALHELAQRCEVVFGDHAQDLEWAFARGKLQLLQRRPITRKS